MLARGLYLPNRTVRRRVWWSLSQMITKYEVRDKTQIEYNKLRALVGQPDGELSRQVIALIEVLVEQVNEELGRLEMKIQESKS